MAKQQADRRPTTAESLDATISCMGGNRTWPSTDSALRVVLGELEGDCYSADKVALLRKRLERGGPIVKPAALLTVTDYTAWIAAFRIETATPGRRAHVALLTSMELLRDTALRIAVVLRLDLYAAGWMPRGHQTIEGVTADRLSRVA
jgi:hypothetical protein